MSSLQADDIYKTRAQVLQEVLAAWALQIPDIGLSTDTIIYIWCWVFANSVSDIFLGLQLLHNDMFVQTMSQLALQREGEELGRQQKTGTLSTGSVTFSGAGGTFIESGSQVGAPQPAIGNTLVFETTDDATIPNPGTPTAPTTGDSGTAGNPTGTLEYAVTFVTDGGETELGASSVPLTVAAHQVSITNIPLGGAGTTKRNLYRSKNGGAFQFVGVIADNTQTTYTDNVADGSLGGAPPAESTAESVTVAAAAVAAGVDNNVGIGAISVLVQVDGDVTSVTNAATFTGGEDPESVAVFRQALLQWKQNPQSGSADDLVAWATSINGVDTASVFKNVNLDGDAEVGSVVVRVSGPNGTIPDSDKVNEVESFLNSKVLANITIYVGTFDELDVDVTVHVAPLEGYVLADITPSVTEAISAYVNGVSTGGVVFVAGLYHAVYGLPGVRTLVVDEPTDDVEATATQKPVVGVVTVDEEPWS